MTNDTNTTPESTADEPLIYQREIDFSLGPRRDVALNLALNPQGPFVVIQAKPAQVGENVRVDYDIILVEDGVFVRLTEAEDLPSELNDFFESARDALAAVTDTESLDQSAQAIIAAREARG